MKLTSKLLSCCVGCSLVVVIDGCSRGQSDTTQENPLKFNVVMPASFANLTFEGIEIQTSGARQSEVSNEGKYNQAGCNTVLFNKMCFDSKNAIAGYAVIVLQNWETNEVDLLLCGQPLMSVEYKTNSDYSISRISDSSSSVLLKCILK